MSARAALWLLVALASGPAQALDWAALWQRQEQRARSAIEAGEPARGLALAGDDATRALARFRQGDYAAAATDYRAAGELYNTGTALVQAGEYGAAIAAFDRALDAVPGDAAARDNRAIAEQLLALSEAQPPAESGEQGEGGAAAGEGEPGGADQPADGGGEGPPARQSAADGEVPGDGAAAAEGAEGAEAGERPAPDPGGAADGGAGAGEAPGSAGETESQQAIDQWLQRVPDDPGGLLRARILREHRRAYAELPGAEQPW